MSRKPPLQYRFILSVALVSIALLILWSGYYFTTYQAASQIARANTILTADSLTQQISAEFQQMNTIASVIAGSEYVQDFLSEGSVAAYYEKAGAVSEIVRKTAFPISSVDAIVSISESGRFYRFSGGLSGSALEALNEILGGKDTVYTVVAVDRTLFFCHSVPVVDYTQSTPVRLGNIVLLTTLDKTRRLLEHDDAADRAVLLDGGVILASNPDLEGLTTDEMEALYSELSIAPVTGTGLSVIAAIPGNALFPEAFGFYIIALVSLGLLIVMVYSLYRYQSYFIIRPMANIIAGVRAIGDQEGRLPDTGIADFDALAADINAMLDRTEEYNAALALERQKLFDNESVRQNMRLSLLASQMDAHFVVNTLKSVKRLAEVGESAKAARMAEELAAILQHLHTGDALVNVFADLEILEKYIDIINMKFDGKFSVKYAVDDKLVACRMPCFILQPIVENALMHGLGNKERDAELTITGVIDGGSIVFQVSDNGAGIAPPKLKELQESLAQTELGDFPEPGLRGVALLNITRRIRISHGDCYGISVASEQGKGTTVTVTLPLIPSIPKI
jgi:two-component system sensor histidine kinase YesM